MAVYDKYLVGNYECSCTNTHIVTTKKIIIERNAIKKIPGLIEELGLPKNIFVVFDENTYEAAGKEVLAVLGEAGIEAGHYMFKNENILHPDENAIGALMMAMEPMPELLIAVGSGTLNDLARFCATRLKIPYFVVATAPSMDGFASGVIPVTRAGMKVSYIGITPEMVIGDLDVLAASPLKLMAAGFGDIIGKVPARLDWMFGNVAFGEAMCPEIEALMNSAVEKSIQSSPELDMRTYEATEGVMEALALAGVAMQMNGNSRPASGAEHHMAHFLEMRDGHYNRPNAYHGAKVGMTSLISMRLYEKFFEAGPPPQGVVPEAMETRAKVKTVYGKVGDAVLDYKGETYIEGSEWKARKEKIIVNWDVFKANVDGFGPLRKQFGEILKECSGPMHPRDLGYTKEDIFDAIMYARMLRRIPTILEVLANWGYLEKYATEIIDELF